MKTLGVAVAIVLTFICIQKSLAVPVSEVKETEDPVGTDNPGAEYEETSVETWMVQELEEPVGTDNPAAEYEETSVETWMMPFNIRGKHQSGPIRCRYCCGCCALGVCGMCCK